jgi:CheY-like chemotaxis protein
MKSYAIQPFHFPTTVAFVDDSLQFLSNLSLQLDSRLAFRLFHSPFSALIELNGASSVPPMVERFFSIYRHRGDTSYARHVIDLSLDMIHREVHNERRFEQVSVVVVDYDMPEIDGLEFCRSIKNPAIKKIMLTGKADEQIAVRAFNERIIDRFIRKQDVDVMSLLNRTIAELQQEHFQQIEHMLSDALAVGSHMFLRDPGFAQRFEEIRESLGIVEHYLSCAPDGILMLNMTGTAYLLIVQTEQMMQGHYEIAFEQEAPEELLEQLRSGRSLPYFWKTAGNYSPIYEDWQPCLHPATEFKGQDWYLYTLVKNPGAFDLKYVYPYSDYLDRLDSEARQGATHDV